MYPQAEAIQAALAGPSGWIGGVGARSYKPGRPTLGWRRTLGPSILDGATTDSAPQNDWQVHL